MDYILNKYIGQISTRLERFQRKGPSLFNFRCNICGDSQTHKHKTRAYFYEKSNKMLFHCHNCNATMSVPEFIKIIDLPLYNEYVLEKIKESGNFKQFNEPLVIPKVKLYNPLRQTKKIIDVKDERVINFIKSRKIPIKYQSKLYFVNNFMNYVNTIIPNKFSEKALKHDESRIIIPFINKKGDVHAMQGRSIDNKIDKSIKYITIVLDDTVDKIYGLDTVNLLKPIKVLEGPIDSMFLDNSISTAGGDLVSTLGNMNKDMLTIVYDNEPRAKFTINKMRKSIKQNYKICIWPSNIEEKDINDMILSGMSSDYIQDIIEKNTYHGLEAEIKLSEWRKV